MYNTNFLKKEVRENGSITGFNYPFLMLLVEHMEKFLTPDDQGKVKSMGEVEKFAVKNLQSTGCYFDPDPIHYPKAIATGVAAVKAILEIFEEKE